MKFKEFGLNSGRVETPAKTSRIPISGQCPSPPTYDSRFTTESPHVSPSSAYLPLTPDMTICHILKGMWQVSGAHGAINPQTAV